MIGRRAKTMKPSHLLVVAAVALLAAAPKTVLAHCDTLDGPVVRAARAALDAKDVTPVFVHHAQRFVAAGAGVAGEGEEHGH
jgi:hypothetical protein